MKGMFTKAFSLALLISVAPSFAMETKSVAETATAAATTASQAVANIVPTPIAQPSYMDMAKNAWKSVANSRVAGAASTAAGYVGSALVAPFDYTLGLAANKSGLANYVSNVGFVKNDSYYNATIGGGVRTAARYALGLGLVYGGYKAVKYAYNRFVQSPAKDAKTAEKAAPSQATAKAEEKPAQAATIAPAAAAKPEFVSKEHEEMVKALEVVLNKVVEGKSKVADSQEMIALGKLPYMQEFVVSKTNTGNAKSKVKTYADTVLGHVAGIDNAKDLADREARVLAFTTTILTIKQNASIYFGKVVAAERAQAREVANKAASKARTAQAARALSWSQAYDKAYNMLVNRYAIAGLATATGFGLAGYKYYNRVK